MKPFCDLIGDLDFQPPFDRDHVSGWGLGTTGVLFSYITNARTGSYVACESGYYTHQKRQIKSRLIAKKELACLLSRLRTIDATIMRVSVTLWLSRRCVSSSLHIGLFYAAMWRHRLPLAFSFLLALHGNRHEPRVRVYSLCMRARITHTRTCALVMLEFSSI